MGNRDGPSRSGLTDNLLGRGLRKVLGNVEGLEVELDSSSGDGLDSGGAAGTDLGCSVGAGEAVVTT